MPGCLPQGTDTQHLPGAEAGTAGCCERDTAATRGGSEKAQRSQPKHLARNRSPLGLAGRAGREQPGRPQRSPSAVGRRTAPGRRMETHWARCHWCHCILVELRSSPCSSPSWCHLHLGTARLCIQLRGKNWKQPLWKLSTRLATSLATGWLRADEAARFGLASLREEAENVPGTS